MWTNRILQACKPIGPYLPDLMSNESAVHDGRLAPRSLRSGVGRLVTSCVA